MEHRRHAHFMKIAFRPSSMTSIRVAVAAIALSLSSIASGATGLLLDQDDNPVPGAWVVATREECRGLAHCNSSCVEVHVTMTDDNGAYSFDSGPRVREQYRFAGYREGYISSLRQAGRTVGVFMIRGAEDQRFTKMDSLDNRIAYLVQQAREMACWFAPAEQRRELIPVYKAMFREATSIARHPEQHKTARSICREIYSLTVDAKGPSLLPDAERKAQESVFREIEPACLTPIDDNREQAVLWAIARRDREFIRSVSSEGFDFNRLLDGRDPPITVAATKGFVDIIAELAAGGARADMVGKDGKTALARILEYNIGPAPQRLAVVRALLDAGADPNRRDLWGYPPIVRVANSTPTDPTLFDLLIEHGARINETVSGAGTSDGRTVLHVVTVPALARSAIEHGANVNAKDSAGFTPLMSINSPEVTRLLLEHGADPNIATGGWTPLMFAVQSYQSSRGGPFAQRPREIAEMLVAAGARLSAVNQHGMTAHFYTSDLAFMARLHEIAARRQSSKQETKP